MATKRKQLAKWTRSPIARVGSVEFGNGGKRNFRLDDIHEDAVDEVLWYGLKQKLADAGSDALTVTEFEQAVMDKWQDIQNGLFNRTGGGGSNVFLEAIARVKGVTVEAVRVAVDAADDEQIKKWKAHPTVKSAMADITAERARARLGTTLDELDIEIEV